MTGDIQLFEIASKEKLGLLKREFRNEILDGNINPLLAAAVLKALEDFTGVLRSDVLIKDCIREELEKYPEKVVKFNGCEFTKKTVGTKYDFSKCNDPKYITLKNKVDIAAALLKEREDFLKIVPHEGLEIVDDGTGEVTTVLPPLKLCEEGYSVSIKS
jgi:hypothetical protein